MKLEVNISKKHLIFIFSLFLVGSVYAVVSHSASDVFLLDGTTSVQTAIDDLETYVDNQHIFTPGDFIVAEANDSVHPSGVNAKIVMTTFFMGQGGSANFSAKLFACRSDTTAVMTYKLNDVDVGYTCSTNTNKLCSTIINFDKGDKIELFMQATKYCASDLKKIRVKVDRASSVHIID